MKTHFFTAKGMLCGTKGYIPNVAYTKHQFNAAIKKCAKCQKKVDKL